LPLGMFRDTRYHEYYLSFEPGDMLVLYTDGVTEALNPAGEEFGKTRLADAAKAAYSQSAREVIRNIEQAVLDWTDGQGANDDITFFIIKDLQH